MIWNERIKKIRRNTNSSELSEYVINIYKTMMFRGIRGTFVYACDKNLREYFKKHIEINKRY